MKKVIITTALKGYNYGTSLQAYASKLFLSSLGYDPEIIWYKDGIIKGRDIRSKKLFTMFLRTFWRPKLFINTFSTYLNSLQKEISEKSKIAFLDFEENRLQVKNFSWPSLKSYVRNENVVACICGSDQIWKTTNIYIDPIYYLKFAPKEKRIAYAPSFGKSEIPNYNKTIIKRNISKIDYLSVREEEGAKIIKNLIGREVPVMIDPTLLLNKNRWLEAVSGLNSESKKENYIVLYFLDKPSSISLKYIEEIIKIYDCSVIAIPSKHNEFNKFNDCESIDAGPLEFVNLIANAKFVCTDSFHGTAFSINLNVPFLTFNRLYGAASDQSSRITSLLNKLELQNRFISQTEIIDEKDFKDELTFEDEMTFEHSNELLQIERQNANDYLLTALSSIESES
ncbi:hypothetical protein FM115_07680 [Marinilactibacillus psychrotolerans 42ea]|uniref:Polysaccharide pyruvyl transferase domain-containing protein n=1 Tax=Marinilactibacillus psychrotolerans 42ea TaxID=1255609 RepID=A0A1R4K0V9_9LACT|nr:polysaccharide pyruvyl transferase family protein [Marinilactibacillus psychrotolerans]SJN37916.1 hypothetical protein FM115_07680 [Marinilactibacillus psychrotolerans 42ea]